MKAKLIPYDELKHDSWYVARYTNAYYKEDETIEFVQTSRSLNGSGMECEPTGAPTYTAVSGPGYLVEHWEFLAGPFDPMNVVAMKARIDELELWTTNDIDVIKAKGAKMFMEWKLAKAKAALEEIVDWCCGGPDADGFVRTVTMIGIEIGQINDIATKAMVDMER